jgi:hypothetical protein
MAPYSLLKSATILALLACALPAVAQTTPAPPPAQPAATGHNGGGIGFGAAFGISKTSLRGDEDEGLLDGRAGIIGGVWFGGNRSGTVGVGADVLYGIRKFEDFGDDLEQHYLEVPVLLRVNFGSRNRNGAIVYGVAGPVVDIKLSTKLDDVDVTDDYAGTDVGLIGGVGVEVARIGFEMRGNWGLRSFYDPRRDLETIKTFAIQLLGKIRIN